MSPRPLIEDGAIQRAIRDRHTAPVPRFDSAASGTPPMGCFTEPRGRTNIPPPDTAPHPGVTQRPSPPRTPRTNQVTEVKRALPKRGIMRPCGIIERRGITRRGDVTWLLDWYSAGYRGGTTPGQD